MGSKKAEKVTSNPHTAAAAGGATATGPAELLSTKIAQVSVGLLGLEHFRRAGLEAELGFHFQGDFPHVGSK